MADSRFTVIVEVPHAVRAWRWVAAAFDERLAAQVLPPVVAADLVAEIRRGREELRLRIAVTVRAGDVGQAVTAAWDVLEEATSDIGEFDLARATLEAGPAPLMPGARGLNILAGLSRLEKIKPDGSREVYWRQAELPDASCGYRAG